MDQLNTVLSSISILTNPVIFFPVRHHSPVCSYHLLKLLDSYKPDAILIEGPSDTNHLISHIGDANNSAPLCIYYSYFSTKHAAASSHSSCYYPLLDFSPELCAIRYGQNNNIHTRFIDLPYSQLWATVSANSNTGSKNAYYDDYYLNRSQYLKRLCEKQGCRHYSELWEKLFEIGGLTMPTQDFIKAMAALCHYARIEYPRALLASEGCLERESYMTLEIMKASKHYQKIIVITGGFHTAALWQNIKSGRPPKIAKAQGQADAYLIPYAFTESDQLAGYASGMPYPAFYQKVFENIQDGVPAPYNEAVLTYMAKIGAALRKNRESISIADEIAATLQADGLARIRDKAQQGVYELLDGVTSVYAKGNAGERFVAMQIAGTVLRGDKIGSVITGADQVPLLVDFKNKAKGYRLRVDQALEQATTLDILTKPMHRQKSIFFHRLKYLNIRFAKLKAGPNYSQKDIALIRERWVYRASAATESSIVDASYLGGTIKEAALSAFLKSKDYAVGAGDFSALMIDAAVMDLTSEIVPLITLMHQAIVSDGSFASLVLAAQNILFIESATWLLDIPDSSFAARLLEDVYHKACSLLPVLETTDDKEDSQIAQWLKTLYEIACRKNNDKSDFLNACTALCDRRAPLPAPCMHGSALGILLAEKTVAPQHVLQTANAYFFASGETMKLSGRFLSGLFLSAWDLLFMDTTLIQGLNHVFAALGRNDFLTLLPDLRIAFSTFTPTQLSRIALVLAGMYHTKENFNLQAPVTEEAIEIGLAIDAYAKHQLLRERDIYG